MSTKTRKKRRSFTREFKLSVLARMAETDSIVGLARELGLERKLLYCWRERYQKSGSEALRRVGRPAHRQDGLSRHREIYRNGVMPMSPKRQGAPEQHIEALQRKIGRQQLELIFSCSLAASQARRRRNGAPGEKASTP